MAGFLLTLLAMASIFLIFIVLLQRGRGGGLAGAFGGLGGQSAFGTKAGDVFTKITVGVAVVWVILAAASGFAVTADVTRSPYPGPSDEPTAISRGETGAGAATEDGVGGPVLPAADDDSADDGAPGPAESPEGAAPAGDAPN